GRTSLLACAVFIGHAENSLCSGSFTRLLKELHTKNCADNIFIVLKQGHRLKETKTSSILSVKRAK
ncbi:hypothetical protein, partial [Pseudomonas tremae]|uniref:hypothetical protein n=4 Tax=Pseudomonas syringae group TaxID=136849 RepID=UPI001F202DCA